MAESLPLPVALIGHGAIARALIPLLGERGEHVSLVSVLVRPARVAAVRRELADISVVASVEELVASGARLVVECASHGAVAEHGPGLLAKGIDLVVVSVGALVDPALRRKLQAAASEGGGQLQIASGAIAGLDALAAAARGGLARVRYTARKAPAAWRGSPAEQVCDLARLDNVLTLYNGTVEKAARLYPQNANVAAAIALAGIGFANTEVRLVADPAAKGNMHLIEAEGAFGRLRVELENAPLADNPKTSALTVLSLLRAIENRVLRIVV